jgi:hypothetical protein
MAERKDRELTAAEVQALENSTKGFGVRPIDYRPPADGTWDDPDYFENNRARMSEFAQAEATGYVTGERKRCTECGEFFSETGHPMCLGAPEEDTPEDFLDAVLEAVPDGEDE